MITNDKDNYEVLRPLGQSEKYQLSKMIAGVYNSASFFFRFEVAKPGVVVNPEYLRRKVYPLVTYWFNNHTFLQMGVTNIHTDTPCYTRFKTLDLTKVVRILEVDNFWEPTTIENLMEVMMNDRLPMDETSSPIRLLLCWHRDQPSQFVIISSYNHLASDGLSFKLLLEGMVVDSEETMDMNPIQTLDSSRFKINEPLEVYNPHKVGPLKLGTVLAYYNYMPSPIKRYSNSFWAGTKRQELQQCDSRIRIISVSMTDFVSFIELCGRHKVTVHNGMYTVILQSISEVFGVDRALKLKSTTVVNVRKPCKLVDEDTGIFLSSISRETIVPPHNLDNPKFFWEECTKYKLHLRNRFMDSLLHIGCLAPITDNFPHKMLNYWTKMNRDNPMGRSSSFCISDLGQFNMKEKEGSEWICRDLMAGQTPTISSTALMFSFVGSQLSDHWYGTVSYQRGAITDSECNQLVEVIERNIKRCLTLGMNKL
ncbi:hypothetical protein SAMD00019534_095980 [Acytostelium subglobosum LB1]|uniref:hypothetical protein n=1 Tax=Acytostelium subglobosum LB1 TaxID=1410327 RepID=UPI000644C177|nr:hypothetical protein SAMD00019534_095980 [Acytostelium subglobosum LB1]GAM26423.1 hypothetical protein SAMD00019534_095980 [Acytostelium subglobosum LB1]|eukprot:XP_012750519.1 hypothetical protein SAMD00019534_095980 [Acytostelium subglobosum LB1]